MKKYSIIIAMLVVFVTGFSAYGAPLAPGVENPDNTQSDWLWYSKGLFYKSMRDYNRAIECFKKSESSGRELARVYFQIAGCYYHMRNFEMTNSYAGLSIKQDRKYVKPYLLMYNSFMRLRNHQKAADTLEDLLAESPGIIDAHHNLGNLYYNNLKKYRRARIHFEKIIELSTSQIVDNYYREYAHYYLGYLYYRKHDREKSVEHFKKVVELNPGNSSAIFIIASVLMDQYRLNEAEPYVREYLSRYSDNSRVNSFLGRTLYLRDDLEAVKYLRRSESSLSVDGILSKALLMEIHRNDEGLDRTLKFIIAKNPEFISPHVALGKWYLRNRESKLASGELFTSAVLLYNVGLLNEAENSIRKVLAIDATIPEVYVYLGRINEERNNPGMAILNYTKSNELRENPAVISHLGYLYTQKNDYGKAVQMYDRAIELEPSNSKNYFLKGLMYSNSDRYTLAEQYMRKAIRLHDDDLYYFYLATVLEKQKRYDDTFDSLKKAISKNPKSSRAYNYLGYLYAERNIRIDESIMLINKALEMEPNNGAYLDSLGWAYFRKGRYHDALGKLKEAEKRLEEEGAPDAVVFDHIGDTYEKIGVIEKAVDYWRKSIKLENKAEVQKKIRKYPGK